MLTSDMCRIHLGTHDALHVTVRNERIYGGVYATQAFPARYPNGYISLICNSDDGDEIEIGIIRDLADFSPHEMDLIRRALARRFFIHTITKIFRVRMRYGYIQMKVETDKGPAKFFLQWDRRSAINYGKRGKSLIDIDDNRYLIPDIRKLPRRQRREFTRHIYW